MKKIFIFLILIILLSAILIPNTIGKNQIKLQNRKTSLFITPHYFPIFEGETFTIEVKDNNNNPIENVKIYFIYSDGSSYLPSPYYTNQYGIVEITAPIVGKHTNYVIIAEKEQYQFTTSFIKVITPGDIDGDGDVDTDDFSLFTKSFGTSINNENYEKFCDYNKDSQITFNDYQYWLECYRNYSDTSIAIFIDTTTYNNLINEISRFMNDIENDLNTNMFLFINDWNNATEIRNIIIDKYQNNNLLGSILIGEIPTIYFEYQDISYPSDNYFQDLDGVYIDDNGDGDFETELHYQNDPANLKEIWSSRIKPPVVYDEEYFQLLKNYFDKNHAYRIGEIQFNKSILLMHTSTVNNQYNIDEIEYNNFLNSFDENMGLYNSNEQIEGIYEPNAQNRKDWYLSKITENKEFIFFNGHGSTVAQYFNDTTYIFYDEIMNNPSNGMYVELLSCFNGRFTAYNYLAGWYLFSGNTLVVTANTPATMVICSLQINAYKYYDQLKLGINFGDMYKMQTSITNILFGDPTLTLREKPTQDIPILNISNTSLDFGNIETEGKKTINVTFKNDGNDTLTIDFRSAFIKRPEGIDYWSIFYYGIPYPNYPDYLQTFKDFELEPGENIEIPFIFEDRYENNPLPEQNYYGKMLFYTNDPDNPFLYIECQGNLQN